MDRKKSEEGAAQFPLKSYRTTFQQEVAQAIEELDRPSSGLFLSGLTAGFGIGTSVLLISVVLSQGRGAIPEVVLSFFLANAYSVGFVIVILANTDLFTEYTTIAILPVLTGDANLRALARLWGLVYAANLIGGVIFAALLVTMGPEVGAIDEVVFAELARELSRHQWWVILISGGIAGWLMGLMSWLVAAGRETVSQILFVWVVAGAIGFGHLHHSIVGGIELFAAAFLQQVSLLDVGRVMLLTTAGNVAGSVTFAVLIRYSLLVGGRRQEGDARMPRR
jgi:formate-nitrite transporter family protein